MKPPKMLATVYRRAAKVIRERGWSRSGARDMQKFGPVSVVGAIAAASGTDAGGRWIPGLAEFWRLIGYHRDGVLGWNQASWQTRRNVLSALKLAERTAARVRVGAPL